MMKLILNGDANKKQGERQGIYILGEKLVNNHPYWEQQNGSSALWFLKVIRYWMVGPKTYLGQDHGGIIGPQGIDRSPTRIISGWRYFDNVLWKDAATSEIEFKNLSPGMHLFKLVGNSLQNH